MLKSPRRAEDGQIRQHRGVDRQRESLKAMSYQQLIELKEANLADLVSIKGQLDTASAEVKAGGLHSDPRWWSKTNAARAHKGFLDQAINRRLTELKRERAQATQSSLPQCFMEAARDLLTPEVFERLLKEATERHAPALSKADRAEHEAPRPPGSYTRAVGP